MAWGRPDGQDIGSAISKKLGREVVNRAALGSHLRASGLTTLAGFGIPGQVPEGAWNWVVINGGANDLGFTCRCVLCDGEIELLIAEDGSGVIPDMIEAARTRGAQVIWLGYYAAPEARSFEGCRPGLVEIERRVADYAGLREGVFFLDAEDVFDPTDKSLFYKDKTHPSPKGSALIGGFIAGTIAENS